MNAPQDLVSLSKKSMSLPFSMAWRESFGDSADPFGMFTPIVNAQVAWFAHPMELAERAPQFWNAVWDVARHTSQRMLGLPSEDPIKQQPDDTRFTDPAWTEHALWDGLKEWYLLYTHQIEDMLYETPGLSKKDRRRAAFWWRTFLNAAAPTNFFWTNPCAMRQAIETRGDSIRRGLKNFQEDLQAGLIRMTDPTDFKVGGNLATTPGAVIARNRLVEVIHYTPTQPKVHATPIVIITPWINKFYILDLTSKKSMVKFLVDQGFDVYITSWKNPDEDMAQVSFDDYVIEGVEGTIKVAQEVSGAKQVHAVGYCIGGTALAIYMAWAARAYPAEQQPVAHWTLLTAMTDFSRPGDIEVFIDEGSVDYMTETMNEKGFLSGKSMSSSFRLLRSNPLIWHYYVHSYLYGEKPPPFDALYWNTDMTRMPARMHSWYLRELYLKNRLIVSDALTIAGQPLDLCRITQPLYSVGCEDDHIAPWQEAYRVINFITGPKRYVLTSSGHIFGIVNPPVDPPKRKYCADVAHRAEGPVQWRARVNWQDGSWWTDWINWLRPQMGEQVDAPPLARGRCQEIAKAPGLYVLEP